MKKQDFHFDLPQELIAQHPLENRTDSRLLAYSRHNKSLQHQLFTDLTNHLQAGDLLVMNNSKVIPARFYGTKETGGKVEFLIERLQDEQSFFAHIRASKAPRAGMRIFLEKGWTIRILEKCDDLYHCILDNSDASLDTMLEDIGHMPLPLYIDRQDEIQDRQRYQTVYALHKGSVAAPTAGLHFDEILLKQLQEKGIRLAYSTLHVGAGTFRPLRTEAITDHIMHTERCMVSQDLCDLVNETKASKHRVIAVGTTALRCLETAASKDGLLQPYDADTNIFIYPGYQFKICDGLITNFHLPESTLLMLVSAFIGHTETMALYQEAMVEKYRFYSYGDACLFL